MLYLLSPAALDPPPRNGDLNNYLLPVKEGRSNIKDFSSKPSLGYLLVVQIMDLPSVSSPPERRLERENKG